MHKPRRRRARSSASRTLVGAAVCLLAVAELPGRAAAATSTAMASGATFVQRNGLYDVYSVGAGTFEFTSAP